MQSRECCVGYFLSQKESTACLANIFKPVSLEVPASPFLFLSAPSSFFRSHAHVALPHCPPFFFFFHPLCVQVLHFKHFSMLLCAHTHAPALFSSRTRHFPVGIIVWQWRNKAVNVKRHSGRRAKNSDQTDYICHNPSTGQGIFLFS